MGSGVVGRPSKLTDETRDAIVARVREGVHPDVAAQCEGVGASTCRGWIQRGKLAEESEGDIAESEVPYLAFSQAILRARAEFEADTLQEVRASLDVAGNTQHSKWILERLFPERYSQKITVDLKDRALEELLDRLREGLDPETFSRVVGVLLGTGGAEASDEGEDGRDAHPVH